MVPKTHLLVLKAAILTILAPTPGQAVQLELTTPGRLDRLTVGQSVQFDMTLSSLDEADAISAMGLRLEFDPDRFGLPGPATPGTVVPDPLHDPGDFLHVERAGLVDVYFSTLTDDRQFMIRSGDEPFFGFEMPVTRPGTGHIQFAFAGARGYLSAGGAREVDLEVTFPGSDRTATITAFRPAQASGPDPQAIAFGDLHTGHSAQQAIAIGNIATNDGLSESLIARFGFTSGHATASGSVSKLAPGRRDSQSLVVGIDTTETGPRAGIAVIEFTSSHQDPNSHETAIAEANVQVSATVWQLAEPVIPAAVDLGLVHIDDQVSFPLTVRNDAPATPFSERLSARAEGDLVVTAAGRIAALGPQAEDRGQITLGLDTATAGRKQGQITVLVTSDPAGINDLGPTALPPATVSVHGQVNHWANPALTLVGSGGTLAQIDPTHYELDLGTEVAGQAVLAAQLQVVNRADEPADELAGNWQTTKAPDFAIEGIEPFAGLPSGQAAPPLVVSLAAGKPGDYVGQLVLLARGTNASGFDGPMPQIVVSLSGSILIPEPSSSILLVACIMLLAPRWR